MRAPVVIVLLVLTACRYPELPQLMPGDGSVGDDSFDSAVDSRMTDAMPDTMRTCYLDSNIPALSLGTSQGPAIADFFYTPTAGPHTGIPIFRIAAALDQGGTKAIVIEVARPGTGFQTNVAYQFDPLPTGTWSAYAALLGDYDGTIYRHTLTASNGSLTFTSVSESQGASITGSVTMTNFREVDAQGADVPGGCTSTLAGINLFLQQQNQ